MATTARTTAARRAQRATPRSVVRKTKTAQTKPAAAKLNSAVDPDGLAVATRDHFESLAAAYSNNADAMRERTEDMLDAARESVDRAQNRLQKLNTELAEAAREEISETVQFANDLANAKTFADALEIQRNYWTSIFEHRMERTRDLTAASVEAARESFEPLTESMAAAFGAVTLEKFFPPAQKH